MAQKNYLYTESAGSGDEYLLKEAGDFDYPPGAIPYEGTLSPSAHRIIVGDATRAPIGVQLPANSLVGRTTGGVAALTATETRTLLNVEDGANAAQGQNTEAGDTITKTVELYRDATGLFGNRLNFRVLRPKNLTRIHLQDLGDVIEADSLVVPSVFNIHGDGRIAVNLPIPIMRASQRMELIEVLICPYFNVSSGSEALSLRIVKNSTPVSTGATIWIETNGYSNGTLHQDAEGTGYIDTLSSKWSVPDDGSRTLNSGDWLILLVTQKHLNSGSTTGASVEFLTLTCKYGYI